QRQSVARLSVGVAMDVPRSHLYTRAQGRRRLRAPRPGLGARVRSRHAYYDAHPRVTDPVRGNCITLLRNGVEYFPALEAEFDGARQEIHLETYIFASDRTGRDIAAALARAARRGGDSQ